MLSRAHLTFIDAIFSSYEHCLKNLKSQEKIGMYGTGAFGFLGTVNTSLTVNDLEMIYDDNSSLWELQNLAPL